jgi:hypothetical protein
MVNRLILLFLILQTGQPMAHTKLVQNLVEDKEYYSHYLSSFSKWFNKNIYSWEATFNNHKFEYMLKQHQHWFIKGSPLNKREILWGIGHNQKTDKVFYILRYHQKENPGHFVIWRSDKEAPCYEDQETLICGKKTSTYTVQKIKDPLYSFPLTKNKNFIFQEFVDYQRNYFTKGVLSSVFYRLNNVQAEWLPAPLLKIIYKIGMETRLPLDKIEITNNHEIIIYYP